MNVHSGDHVRLKWAVGIQDINGVENNYVIRSCDSEKIYIEVRKYVNAVDIRIFSGYDADKLVFMTVGSNEDAENSDFWKEVCCRGLMASELMRSKGVGCK